MRIIVATLTDLIALAALSTQAAISTSNENWRPLGPALSTRREIGRRPMRRDREDEFDLAHIGGETDAATSGSSRSCAAALDLIGAIKARGVETVQLAETHGGNMEMQRVLETRRTACRGIGSVVDKTSTVLSLRRLVASRRGRKNLGREVTP